MLVDTGAECVECRSSLAGVAAGELVEVGACVRRNLTWFQLTRLVSGRGVEGGKKMRGVVVV